MVELVYILCAVMSAGCAILLFLGYIKNPTHLLLWSCVCFCILTASNVILVLDLIILPELDFHGPFWRNVLSASASGLLLFGLIWEIT